jgi:hypothetical protein
MLLNLASLAVFSFYDLNRHAARGVDRVHGDATAIGVLAGRAVDVHAPADKVAKVAAMSI